MSLTDEMSPESITYINSSDYNPSPPVTNQKVVELVLKDIGKFYTLITQSLDIE